MARIKGVDQVKCDVVEQKRDVEIKVRSLHGPMIDLTTNMAFTSEPVVVEKITSWIQSQVDAGKMEIV